MEPLEPGASTASSFDPASLSARTFRLTRGYRVPTTRRAGRFAALAAAATRAALAACAARALAAALALALAAAFALAAFALARACAAALAFAFFSAVRARAARVLAALRLMAFSRSTVWAELDALLGGARTLLDAAAV